MLLAEERVAVATCHASRCVTTIGGNLFYEAVIDNIFYWGAPTLGEAVLAAKQAVISENPGNDWLYGPAVLQTILGDPALRIRLPELPPMALQITLTGPGSARLTWEHIATAARYEIYRGTSAYSVGLSILPWRTVYPPTSYVDFTEGLGDCLTNYFFAGKARNQSLVSPLSNVVGEFDFQLED
jgi:hypothetical protein